MGTLKLSSHYRLLGHCVRPFIRMSGNVIRINSQFSSHHCTLWRDVESIDRTRRSFLCTLQNVSGGGWRQERQKTDFAPKTQKVWRRGGTPAGRGGTPGARAAWTPNVDSRVSSELQILNAEDFSEARERYTDSRMNHSRMNDSRMNDSRRNDSRMNNSRINHSRMNDSRMNDSRTNDSRMNNSRMNDSRMSDSRMNDSREDGDWESVFGVSPCLLALSQGRRAVRRLFVKEGEAYQRSSVRQVCEEAYRRGVQVQRVSKKELERMCPGRVHQGVCLQASPLAFLPEERSPEPADSSGRPLWLVLDGVQDPMNLGAVLRSAYFLGVDRVASSLHNSCSLTPVVSKASSGVMEIMGVYGYESLAGMVKERAGQGWQVVGTVGAEDVDSRSGPVRPCSSFRMTRPTLLLMGGEGAGLSAELRRLCDTLLTIPPRRDLHPGVESLNVSVATGILLHSLLSSRGGGR